MSKTSKYAIHADFLHFPTINFKFNTLFVGLINALLRVERVLRQGRLMRAATKHRVASTHGDKIKVLQFNPARPGEEKPAVIYLHGGAYALTYASSHVYSVDCYARQAECTVFLVDYRLAPRHPFPVGFNDCCHVLQWVGNNASMLGVDAQRIAMMGDSAGGGLSASVSQWAHDKRRAARNKTGKLTSARNAPPQVVGQVLIYPTADRSCSTPSALEFHDVPLWNGVSNRAMWSSYLRAISGRPVPAYAAPADRDDLSGLPPAYVETAEYDPLRDEGIAYANRLIQAGVETDLNRTQQTIHGFDTVFSSGITQHSLNRRGQYLRRLFYGERVMHSTTPQLEDAQVEDQARAPDAANCASTG